MVRFAGLGRQAALKSKDRTQFPIPDGRNGISMNVGLTNILKRPRLGMLRRRGGAEPNVKRESGRGPHRIQFKEFAPLNGQTLVLPTSKLGIIWSPKCACTKVVLWYFKMTGLLEAALFYHPWPHNYRMNVLYASDQYTRWVKTADWKNFTWYQFCRDPVKRALSSYRHSLGQGHADERISRALQRPASNVQGYSLEEFLRYLEIERLAGPCDPHVKFQTQELSKSVPVKIINIDEVDMLEQMNVIERQHGLPITNFSSIKAFESDEKRRAKIGTHGAFSLSRVLTREDARGTWPLEASMLDTATIERIKRIYARDMKFIYGGG
jgi:hypothetical protein